MSRVNFIQVMVEQYKARGHKKLPHGSVVVASFIKYFKSMYDEDIKKGKTRKLSYLSSVQTGLSHYKKALRELGAPADFLNQLCLSRKQTAELIREKKQNVKQKAIDLPAINGDGIIQDCIQLLQHSNVYLQVVALACLTGRRMAELLYSIKFGSPREKHFTNEKFWSCVTGILKQRGENQVICREVPLFAPRVLICQTLRTVRKKLPAKSVREVNAKYGKPVARVMKKYCSEIGNLHQFRKFYVLACHSYFNERHCSLPRLAADYLGHKTMSDTVLTYLNFRLVNLNSLEFGKGKKI
jgi:hypothetical protein